MLYQKLKEYIIEHPNVSLGELSSKFGLPSEQIQSLLSVWIEKGSLKKIIPYIECKSGSCGCVKCAFSSLETYVWVG
jgi:putative ferrous iron transport protein C